MLIYEYKNGKGNFFPLVGLSNYFILTKFNIYSNLYTYTYQNDYYCLLITSVLVITGDNNHCSGNIIKIMIAETSVITTLLILIYLALTIQQIECHDQSCSCYR